MKHLWAVLHGVLVKGNKIHLKTSKGSVCLLGLVNEMLCLQFVASVEQEGFSEKGKWRVSLYQNTVSFSTVRYCVYCHHYVVVCVVLNQMKFFS